MVCGSQRLVIISCSSHQEKGINGLSSSFDSLAGQLPPPGCPLGCPRPSPLLPLQEGRCSHHMWPIWWRRPHKPWPLYPSPAPSPAPLPWAQWGPELGVIELGLQETAPGMDGPHGTQPCGFPPTGHGTRTGAHPCCVPPPRTGGAWTLGRGEAKARPWGRSGGRRGRRAETGQGVQGSCTRVVPAWLGAGPGALSRGGA